LPFRASDAINGLATGHWLVLDHPYAAISQSDGTFEIRDLPPGKHELIVWHERVGYVVKKYTAIVRANEVTTSPPIHVPVASLQLKVN
jgi:hypothetical protein